MKMTGFNEYPQNWIWAEEAVIDKHASLQQRIVMAR